MENNSSQPKPYTLEQDLEVCGINMEDFEGASHYTVKSELAKGICPSMILGGLLYQFMPLPIALIPTIGSILIIGLGYMPIYNNLYLKILKKMSEQQQTIKEKFFQAN